MIDSNQRAPVPGREPRRRGALVPPRLQGDHRGDAVHVQEDRTADRPGDLPASCKPNRGPAGAPLFLINHWITTDPVPLPSNARKVNAYKPLLARAQECQRIRHHLPNLLAVNFYREGDVFAVVNKLNGVR